jgi:hypothetical protein
LGGVALIAERVNGFFHYFSLLAKKRFDLSNPNNYKTANSAAVGGSAIGDSPNTLAAVITIQALCLFGKGRHYRLKGY